MEGKGKRLALDPATIDNDKKRQRDIRVTERWAKSGIEVQRWRHLYPAAI